MQMLLSPSPVKLRCQHRLGPAGCKPHVSLGVNPWTTRGRLGVWDGAKPSLGSAWAEPILGPGDAHRGCAARKRQLLPTKHASSSRNGLKKSLFGSGAVQQDCAPGVRPAPTGHILPLPGANGIPRGSDHHLHGACKVLWLHICLKSSAREMKVHRSLGTAPQEPRGSCREQEEQGCNLQGTGDSSEPVKLYPPRFNTGFVYGKKPARRRTAAPLRLDK